MESRARSGASAASPQGRATASFIFLLALALAALASGPSSASADGGGERISHLGTEQPFFGVSGALSDRRDFNGMRDAGVGTYRVLFHFRDAKRRENGFYDWRRFDSLVDLSSSRGIELLPLLYGTPEWIHDDETVPPIDSRAAREEWRQLLTELVRRYGPGGLYWRLNPLKPELPIRSWQIWNEPNDPKFWSPAPDAAGYSSLLSLSAGAIRSVDPGARIVSAGIVADPISKDSVSGRDYLRQLLDIPGSTELLNAVAYHPYGRGVTAVRRHVRVARATLTLGGAGRLPIWVTEVGWGSNKRLGGMLAKSRRGQARALKLTMRMLARNRELLGIERALWYYWRDRRDPSCAWCRTAGLIDLGGDPRPALDEFKALTRAAHRR